MALTDLTRISTAGIATGTSLSGAILHGDAHFRGTNAGINSAIFDSSENELNLKDNVKLTFGNAGTSDSEFYFDSNNLIIRETSATGSMLLRGQNIRLQNPHQSNENYIECLGNSSDRRVKIYQGATTRFETTSTGAKVTGILTATSFSGPVVGNTYNASGISTFYNLRVSNNLTVEGTTTTLDTNVTGVDRLEINANSNTDTAIVGIQSGTADIVNLFDGTTEVLTVKDGGSVGIGTINPVRPLHIRDADCRIRLEDIGHDTDVELQNTSGDAVLTTNGDSLVRLQTNNQERLRVSGSETLFNQPGSDTDFRIRTPAQGHMFFVDAGNDQVTIKTSSAQSGAVLTVNGRTHLEQLTLGNNSTLDAGAQATIYKPATNTLAFATAGANERLRIDNNGKVGIGTNLPDGKTHIYESSAGSVTAATDANDLVVESSANVGMSLLTANNSLARIKFGDPDATNAGAFVYNHQNDKLSIITGTGNRMIIGSDMISGRTHYGVARTVGGYTFRETNEGNERAGMHSNASNNLIFKTAAAVEQLRIDANGKVGISTTSPTAKLTVGKETGGYMNSIGIQVNRPHSLGLQNGILVYTDNGYNATASYRAAAFKAVGTGGAAFGVSTDQGSNGLGGTLNARIAFDGGAYFLSRVGIGTDSPNQKLTVFDGDQRCLQSGATTFRVDQNASNWNNLTNNTGPILAWDYKSGPGDLMYMGSGGNTPISGQMALVVSDAHGFKIGRSGYDGTDFDVDSSNEYFRINMDGQVQVQATTQSTVTTNGSLVVSGGVGIAKNIICGGTVEVQNNSLIVTSASPTILMAVPSGGLDSRIHNDGNGSFIIGHGTNSSAPTTRLKIGSDGKFLLFTEGQESAEFNTSHASGAYQKYDLGSSGATIGYIGASNQLIVGGAVGDFGFRAQGNMRFSTGGDTERFRIDSNGTLRSKGQFFIRNDAPTIYLRDTDHYSCMLHQNSHYFHVLRGDGADSDIWAQYNNQWPLMINMTNNAANFGGTVSAVGSITGNTSDRRLKKNLVKIETPLEKISKLTGYNFDWNDNVISLGFTPEIVTNDVGLIAQDVQEVVPQAVVPAPFDRVNELTETDRSKSRSGENYLTIQYDKIVPLLVEAIKELKAEIDALKSS